MARGELSGKTAIVSGAGRGMGRAMVLGLARAGASVVITKRKSDIDAIKAKLWDLLPVIRRNVYHPAFGGSFSLKKVAAAILPDMNYDGLDVSEGIQAGIARERFVDPATASEEKSPLKRALLEYCGRDTLALARIIEVLMKQTRASAG